MNKRLQDYINNLFSQVPNSTYAQELKEEMLTNLSDRYEDLLRAGKSKEEAFIIVTSSIGDIRELLSGLDESAVIITTKDIEARRRKSALITSFAVMLYILGGTVLICSSFFGAENLGLILLLIMVTVATGMLVYDQCSKPAVLKDESHPERVRMTSEEKRKDELESIVSSILWTSIVAIYLLLGVMGDLWSYSWIIFIIGAALQNIVHLVFKLKEK